MTHPTGIKIPNDSIITEFKEHLDLEFNQRILFTAPFGAGKSTFINDFEDQYKNEYRFIRLYPVNYAVSGNEDIFELIKFDVLYELMDKYLKEIDLQKEGFSLKLKSYMFLRYNLDKKTLITSLLALGGEIGKPIGEIVKVLWNTYDEFNEFNGEIKENELKFIEDVFSSSQEVIGSPYESNSLSEFLYELINRLKGAVLGGQDVNIEPEGLKKEYKTVLVIDDLDRLDPDHIFRLFNIFSAHTHSITGENKFGFDKILFVCDIENIRKIYAHKYGEGVDFSGYMDKFYSIQPFEFDNVSYINEKIQSITYQYQMVYQDYSSSKFVTYNEYYGDINKTRNLFSAVLKIFLKHKLLNLRSILNQKSLKSYTRVYKRYNGVNVVSDDFLLVNVLYYLEQLMGGQYILEQALLLLRKKKEKNFDNNQSFSDVYGVTDLEYRILEKEIIKTLIPPALIENRNSQIVYSLIDFGIDVNFTSNGYSYFNINNICQLNDNATLLNTMNYDALLLHAYKKLQEYELITTFS